jgi:fibronectin-binding autotransporter adhesin
MGLSIGLASTVQIGTNGFLNANASVLNSGNLTAVVAASTGVTLEAGAALTNNAPGLITAPAPTTGAFTKGILVSGNGVNIANAGLISGECGIVFNVGGSVTNAGTIQGIARNENGFNTANTGAGINAFANNNPVTVVNQSGATIQGLGQFSWGIHTGSSPINVTNFGIISGTVNAINVNGGGTFINEAGGSITSTTFQPIAVTSDGTETIINSGTISSAFGGIGFSNGNASGFITNNVGGIIRGTSAASFGIADGATNVINVVNSGSISGGQNGIILSGGGSVTNNATGSITAAAPATGPFTQGILVSGSSPNIVNAGLISGECGIVFNVGGTVTNATGGTIQGIARNDNGFDSATGSGIDAFANANPVTVVNEAGATIRGVGTDSWGIHTGSTPIFITNFGTISGAVAAINVNGGGTFINEAGALVTSTTFNPVAVTHGTETIINSGTISANFGGIGFGNPAGGGSVTNNAGGVIGGTGPDGFGIASGATNESVSVINSGLIFGASGVDLGPGGGSITNNATGVITASTSHAVSLLSGGNVTIVNAGNISSVSGPGVTLATGSTAMITNSGTISAPSADAIQFVGSAGGSVTNNPGGVLTGGSGHSAILSDTGQVSISNAGRINGNVTLGNAANSVTLLTGGKINGNLSLGPNASSTLALDGTGSQTIVQAVTGTITNSGSLTKLGSGTWTLDAELSAPVSTKVLAGVLMVNSTLNTPILNVDAGGTLAGSGIITGSVINSGLLNPGDAPGTIQIGGDYHQTPSGTLNIQLASATNYSRLVVGGHAFLDGTLKLTLASGFRPNPGTQFNIISAAGGISGTFRTVDGPKGISVSYLSGVVDVTAAAPPAKPVVPASDGTPSSATAIIANDIFFNSLGSLAGRSASESGNSIGIAFDGGEFDFKGQRGEMYGFPIAGHYKINDRVALDYEIPLEYVTLPNAEFFEPGLILNFPIKAVEATSDRPWAWQITPTGAVTSVGSKEVIGAGALTNLLSYRWHGATLSYGNYISFFEGGTLTSNDPEFPKGTSQQIMKNGIKVTIPIGNGWYIEGYGIYTNFFQSAAVSSYYSIGAEVGHHLIWKNGDRSLDLGYYSLGLYTEQGNHYSSGHFQVGSAWRF